MDKEYLEQLIKEGHSYRDIEKITGINTIDRLERITASDIRHILNHHGDKETETKGVVYKGLKLNKQNILDILGDDGNLQVLDNNGNKLTELTNSESKITGFTDHMLVVDSIDDLTMEEINTREYINLAKNLLDKPGIEFCS